MSLTAKQELEYAADVARDSTTMSGADLTYAAMAKQANVPANLGRTYDGARLEQIVSRGIFDDFQRPNSALVGTSPRLESRIWVGSGTTTGILISGNAVVYDGVAAGYAEIDSALNDNFAVRCKITSITANGPRIVLRGTAAGATCAYLFRDQTTNAWALVNDTGTVTVSSTVVTQDIVNNDILEVQVKGDNVFVYLNGVLQVTLTGMAALYPTGTLQGLKGIVSSGFTVDDFYVYGL